MERRALILALTALFVLSGCAGTDVSQQGETAPPEVSELDRPSQTEDLFHPPSNLQRLTALVEKATFPILCDGEQGTAWGYTKYLDGMPVKFVITTHKSVAGCVDGKIKPIVVNEFGDHVEAELLIARHTDRDSESGIPGMNLAILKAPLWDFETLERHANSRQAGSWIMISSFPNINANFYTASVIHSQIAGDAFDLGIFTPAYMNPGSSGGLVINSRGEIVGTLSSTYRDSILEGSFISPVEQLDELFEELR